jgi:hypothetical protein
MKDICKGCKAVECSYMADKKEEECICTTCLVKVMCNQWCEDRVTGLLNNKDTSQRTLINVKLEG